jgi:SAM-dependent methyltransferase
LKPIGIRLAAAALSLVVTWTEGRAAQAPARSPDIHYVPTPTKVVDAMLALADVGPGDVVYDLGSGDGRIPIAAAKLGARGVGIEIDPELVKRARNNADRAGVGGRATFIEDDIFTVDLSPASVVTLYLLGSLNERLRPKIFRETRPGTRIVSHRFRMGTWEPERSQRVDRADLWLWRVPPP